MSEQSKHPTTEKVELIIELPAQLAESITALAKARNITPEKWLEAALYYQHLTKEQQDNV